ncbi:Snf7-domain-containing protein [Trametes polyzona]|nr:Snf7-domain-containing protein [Trametes polyzona]
MSSIPLSKLSTLPTYASASTSRLKSLYSDFTYQKQSNPTSYASNVEWWHRTLEGALLRGWLSDTHSTGATPDRIVLHANGVAFTEYFRVEGVGKPLSIPTVISELCSSRAFIPLSDFLNASRSIYDPGWLPYRIASFVIGKPLWWTLGQLGIVDTQAGTFGDSSTAERWKKVRGDYVAVKLLEQAADRILERQRAKDTGNLADSLYNVESFREEFSSCAFEDAPLSSLDVKVVLKFLERDRRAIVVKGEVIKFVEQGSAESSEVTAVDSGLLALKTAVQKLHAQVESLQHKIDERTRLASEALRQKRKETALTHLRARKHLEDVHKKRLGSLDLLEATLLRVETSAGDIEIMKSYESSTATLREILSHPLLQREKIDETMDAMASANADAREVDDAIQMGAEMAQADAGVDESELEAELDALVRDVEKEKEKGEAAEAETRKRLAAGDLDAPVHSPASPKEAEAEAEAEREHEKVVA